MIKKYLAKCKVVCKRNQGILIPLYLVSRLRGWMHSADATSRQIWRTGWAGSQNRYRPYGSRKYTTHTFCMRARMCAGSTLACLLARISSCFWSAATSADIAHNEVAGLARSSTQARASWEVVCERIPTRTAWTVITNVPAISAAAGTRRGPGCGCHGRTHGLNEINTTYGV